MKTALTSGNHRLPQPPRARARSVLRLGMCVVLGVVGGMRGSCLGAEGRAPGEGFDLVRDGRPAATIVIPDEPLQVVESAAEELRHHVRLISGAELPIVAASRNPQGNLIFLGAEAARKAGIAHGPEPHAWVIQLKDHRLYLAGDDSRGPALDTQTINNYVRKGTLFAVYEFLEKQLGVRWLWPGDLGIVAPPAKSISVRNCDARGKPAFFFARFRDSTVYDHFEIPGAWSTLEAAHAFFKEQAKWLVRHRLSMPHDMNAAHAYTGWWARYGKEHPEYFNLLPDGTRRSDPLYAGGGPQYISMCVSNPDLHKAIVANWLATRTAFMPYVDASENDTCGKCVCERCLGWDVPDPDLGFPWEERVERARKAFAAKESSWWKNLGSLSDRYARFYQAVLEEARKHDPSVKVMCCAYANYVKAPREAKLSPQLIVKHVVGQYYPFTEEQVRSYRADWVNWVRAGASLVLRPNYMLEGGAMPLFTARKRGEDFRFFASQQMIGWDADSLTGQFGPMGPNLYMHARLNDSPRLEVDAVLGEYYGAFGKAEKAVRAYFEYLEKVAENPPDPPLTGGGWFTYGVVGYRQFTPEVMAPARKLIEEAAEAAKGDPLAERRVAYLEKGLRHGELTAAMQRAFAEHKAAKGDPGEVHAALARLVEFRKATESDLIGNYGFLYDWENRHWNIPRLLSQAAAKAPVAPPDPRPKTGSAPAPAAAPEGGVSFVIKLKDRATVDRIRIRNHVNLGGCKDFRVLVSLDNQTYTEALADQLKQTSEPDVAQDFSIQPAEARYLKLWILSGYGKRSWGLRRFEAFAGARNVASAREGAEVIRWTSDYGSYDFGHYSARFLIEDPSVDGFWLSGPAPLPCR